MNESLGSVLMYIDQADSGQVSQIVQALTTRYSQLYPDWETSFLSFPNNDPAQREQILRSVLNIYK